MNADQEKIFENPWASAIFVFVGFFVLLLGSVFMFWRLIVDWKWEFAQVILAIFFLFAASLFLYATITLYFRDAYRVVLLDEEFSIKSLVGPERLLNYSDVKSVEKIKGKIFSTSGYQIAAYDADVPIVYISSGIRDFGALIESLIPRLSRVQKIELGDLPEDFQAWQKDPDTKIINSTRRRTEEL